MIEGKHAARFQDLAADKAGVNERALRETLIERLLVEPVIESLDGDELVAVLSATTFENAGLLTSNEGLVVCLADGSEFQVTILQSKGRS